MSDNCVWFEKKLVETKPQQIIPQLWSSRQLSVLYFFQPSLDFFRPLWLTDRGGKWQSTNSLYLCRFFKYL